jgi:hypothetical protein
MTNHNENIDGGRYSGIHKGEESDEEQADDGSWTGRQGTILGLIVIGFREQSQLGRWDSARCVRHCAGLASRRRALIGHLPTDLGAAPDFILLSGRSDRCAADGLQNPLWRRR